MSADDIDGGVTAWVDPWDTMASWRAGQCDVGALAVVLADELPRVEVVDDELSSNVSIFDGWWREIGDALADFGFEAADFDALFATLVPRLDRRFLRSAPTAGRARLNSSESPLPIARVYLDVDGAYSPLCPQRSQTDLVESIRGPALHVDGAPDTGWTWEMCFLGLGPTPVPRELTAGLAALDAAGIEVVWATTWHQTANALLPIAGVDVSFRATDFETWHGVRDWKWAFVSAETGRDQIPFVWIDDREITPSTWRWASSLPSPPCRLVRTNRFHGLTPDAWADTVAWIEGATGHDVSAVRAASAVPIGRP